jgi:hypothetical protein
MLGLQPFKIGLVATAQTLSASAAICFEIDSSQERLDVLRACFGSEQRVMEDRQKKLSSKRDRIACASNGHTNNVFGVAPEPTS